MRSVLNAFTHWYCKVHARELYALSFLIANTLSPCHIVCTT